MFIALKKDYSSFTPPPKNGGLLTPWAEQGVLLLNTCLTVRAHEANSHSNQGWESFTQKVIDNVVKTRTRGVVFLAWGTPAQKRCARITGTKHLVLKSVHPSPLSASRGFFDCGHFRSTNEWLRGRYGVEGEIDWSLNRLVPIKGPAMEEPVKVTEDGATKEPATADRQDERSTDAKVQGPKTDLPETTTGDRITKKEDSEFDDGEEDEDAIEALEELARSSAVGDGEGEGEERSRTVKGSQGRE
jgi:uracil-DNA glycosylase